MKITVRKILGFALIFTVIISLTIINSFANVVTEHDSCADHYFTTLAGDFIPFNAIGSCAYVATAMLLGYYDAYWNDNFISDIYEQDVEYNSFTNDFVSGNFKTENELLTAWYNQYRSEGGTEDRDDYEEQYYTGFASFYRNQGFLHLDLIGMGEDAGYYEGISHYDKYGAFITDIAPILDDYFDDIFGNYRYYDPHNLNDILGVTPPISIKILDSRNEGTSQQDVVNKIYELVAQGIPVMYQGTRSVANAEGKITSHILIAFSTVMDEQGNITDCNLHTGHITDPLTTLDTTVHDSKLGILWLEIDESQIPHVHCDNYVEGNNRYCSCQVYGDLHEEHEHEKGTLISYDEIKHVYDCKWGCDDPDDIVEELHTLIDYGVDATGNHIYKCNCGYEEERPHIFSRYTPISDSLNARSYHYKICDCGYRELDEHSFVVSANPRYSRCQHCGYTRDEWGSGGSAVIMGKKEDEETE